MSVRAFECRAPSTDQLPGFVALTRVEDWPPDSRIVPRGQGSQAIGFFSVVKTTYTSGG